MLSTRFVAAAVLSTVLLGCSSAATQPPLTKVPTVQITPAAATGQTITIHDGDSTLIDYRGGQYRFVWSGMSPCSSFKLELAPTSGVAPIPIASGPPVDGEKILDVPKGRAYINGAFCGATITVTAL